MAKFFKVPLADGTIDNVQGTVMILPFGDRNLRAFVHGQDLALSHCESGRRICALRPYKILYSRTNRVPSTRAAALMALQDLSVKVGIEKAWSTIDNAPVINAKA